MLRFNGTQQGENYFQNILTSAYEQHFICIPDTLPVAHTVLIQQKYIIILNYDHVDRETPRQ